MGPGPEAFCPATVLIRQRDLLRSEGLVEDWATDTSVYCRGRWLVSQRLCMCVCGKGFAWEEMGGWVMSGLERHFKLVKKTSTRGGRIAVAQATMFLVQVVK